MASAKKSFQRLQKTALGYPEAYAESPWGHIAIKVRNKIFVILGENKDGTYGLSVKLPHTNLMAVSLEFAEPMGYGMGKHGWVSTTFEAKDEVPEGLLAEWIDESFRAVAPKKLVKVLDGGATASSKTKTKKKTAKDAKGAKKKKKPRKKLGKVLLVGEDPLRLGRAERALKEEGATVTTCDHAGLRKLRRRTFTLTVFDLCRRAVASLELAKDHDASKTTLVLAGVRDAKFERRCHKELGRKVPAHRRAPGDPQTVAALVRRLERA